MSTPVPVPRLRSGVPVAAETDRADEDPYAEPEDDQVEDHLQGHEDPGELAGRRYVAEPDGAEDRDREVQRVGPAEARDAEGLRMRAGLDIVRRREQQ